MNTGMRFALLLVVGLPMSAFAVDLPEDEPNESKAQAVGNHAFVLAPGDSVSGITTGTSTTTTIGPSGPTADTFLLRTTPAALGIYRHRMTLTGSGSGRVGTIRGITSTSAGPGPANSDVAFQTSFAATNPPRFNQWYGFGREEEIFYRVTGTATTTATYTSTLTTEIVVPTPFTSFANAGTLTIEHNAATDTAYDRDIFLFDANFNPIAGADEPDSVGLTVALIPGTYYIAYGRSNTAAGTASGSSVIQGTNQTGSVLDFADVVASSSSSTSTQPVSLSIVPTDAVATSPDALGSYDVAWFSFIVLGCSDGLGHLSFELARGDGPIGTPNNSIVTGNFGVPGPINVLRITGRMLALNSENPQARILAIAPDGSAYIIQPFTTPDPATAHDLMNFEVVLPSAEAGAGTWTFEFFETINSQGTDAIWTNICFAADAVATDPAVLAGSSSSAVNDGTGIALVSVRVGPGEIPTSTFLTSGSVTIDGSAIGAGTIVLHDDGVAPDVVAGDFSFAANATVAAGTPVGATPLSIFVTDDQGRSSASASVTIDIVAATPCPADYDNNGGVDGGDLAAFFTDFEAGETSADVDLNGGVDGGDLAYFFEVFEAGGC